MTKNIQITDDTIYGISQAHYGHEYVWIVDKDGLSKMGDIEKFMQQIEEYEYAFKEGGGNWSNTYIYPINSLEQAKGFLTTPGGADSEDPELIEIAEYAYTIDETEGITREICTKLGIKASDYEGGDPRYDELIALGVKPEDFYDDELRYYTYSEILEEYERKKGA